MEAIWSFALEKFRGASYVAWIIEPIGGWFSHQASGIGGSRKEDADFFPKHPNVGAIPDMVNCISLDCGADSYSMCRYMMIYVLPPCPIENCLIVAMILSQRTCQSVREPLALPG